MKTFGVVLIAAVMAGTLNAQEIKSFRFDVGYGGAPMLKRGFDGFQGVHAAVAAETPWGELGVYYVSRSMPNSPYYNSPDMSTTTISFQYGKSWRSSYTQFTISGGMGLFRTTITNEFYFWNGTNDVFSSSTETISQVAFPADMRMCWNLNEHFGLGFAVFGAFMSEYSYAGFHAFARVSL